MQISESFSPQSFFVDTISSYTSNSTIEELCFIETPVIQADPYSFEPNTQKPPESDPDADLSLLQLAAKLHLATWRSSRCDWKLIADKINELRATQLSGEEIQIQSKIYNKLTQLQSQKREEVDQLIVQFYNQEKYQSQSSKVVWSKIAKMICVKMNINLSPNSIHERYINHLDPSIDKTPLTPHEASSIVKLAVELNQSWTKVSIKLQQEFGKDTHRAPDFLKNWYKGYNNKRKQESGTEKRKSKTSEPSMKTTKRKKSD